MTDMRIAILGAGTMGGGIAMNCALSGLQTQVFDMHKPTLERAQARAERYFNRLVEKGALTVQDADHAMARFQPVQTLEDVREADIVIEAIHEDLEAKHGLFAEISDIISENAIVATNTSALRVNDLASALQRPERFLGMHYFSPAEINPVVELVSGEQTGLEALQSAERFLTQTGKTVLRCKDMNGFAVNRFFCPYANEAMRVLDETMANPGQIDQVARRVFDLPLGPFEVMNIVKPRIMLNAVKNLSSLGPFYAPAEGLITAGVLDDNLDIDPEPEALSEEAGREISDRLCGALYLPILEASLEGIASFADFDLGAQRALRFGRPPVEMMRANGRAEVSRIVHDIAARHDHPVPVTGLDLLFT